REPLNDARGSRPSADRRAVFFFQAEDGIRDYKVTGVQTCALPISGEVRARGPRGAWTRRCGAKPPRGAEPDRAAPRRRSRVPHRSEERRVGKEWRSGGRPEPGKKKDDADRLPV